MRRLLMILLPYVTLAALMLGLSACGAEGPDEKDRRYQQCLDAGGDFSSGDGYNEFSCKNVDQPDE